VADWLSQLWDTMKSVSLPLVVLGLSFQLLQTLFISLAWRNILRAAYPKSVLPYRGVASPGHLVVTEAGTNALATFSLAAAPTGSTGADQLSAATVNLTGCTTTVTFTAAGAATRVDVALGQSEFPAGTPKSTSVTATLKDSTGATATATSAETVTFSVDNASICSISPTTATIPLCANARKTARRNKA